MTDPLTPGRPAPGSPLLVCIGDLVEDVVVWTAAPVRPATDNPAQVQRTRGGSAANVAVVAAAAGPTRFIGRVGDDALADQLVAQLETAGVQAWVQRAGRTGTIVVLVDADGERTMFPDRAAAGELADVPASWVAGAGAVHAPAYCFALPDSAATTTALLAAARRDGALTSVDIASVGLVHEMGPDALARAVMTVQPDLIFAGADEADALGLRPDGPVTTLMGALPRTTLVVKDGPRPVRVVGPAVEGCVERGVDGSVNGGAEGGVNSGVDGTVEVPPVADVRDTTGAGDAFAAGYLRAALRGADPLTAAREGVRVAGTVLSGVGVHPQIDVCPQFEESRDAPS